MSAGIFAAAMMGQGGGGGGLPKKCWRISITANHGYSGSLFVEIQLRKAPGGADQTTPAGAVTRAFASSVYTAYAALQAFDDNNATVWFTNIAPSTESPGRIGYMFDSPISINEISLLPVPTGSILAIAPKDFIVESSDDSTNGLNGTWAIEWAVSNEPAWSFDEVRVYTRP